LLDVRANDAGALDLTHLEQLFATQRSVNCLR